MNASRLGKKFWTALAIFGLIGQVAWVVENMYFNVFIYKMFHASAADISIMVGASAVTATVTTILMGAFSDYIGKRKILICLGYILWGISILSFALIRMDLLTPLAGGTVEAASLGVLLVIIMDCVMTFFGSTANDASFNAWMTDWGDETNRGRIEGINSMMPLVAILVVFGGFMAFQLDEAKSWTMIYLIIGAGVILIGVAGFFLVDEKKVVSGKSERKSYWSDVLYSFRPSVIRENALLYAVIGEFAVFGISIQIFMPYLILYYEKTLGMANYVLIMAPAIILAAVITAFCGKLIDMLGFKMSVLPTILILIAGYLFLFFGKTTVPVFIGSLFMMTGYLTGMAVFGAMIRNHIPEHKAGQFQGIRIIGQVLVPGIVGPAIGAAVLRNAETVVNSDGTTSFLPNRYIFLAAMIVALLLIILLYQVFRAIRNSHHVLLSEAGEQLLLRLQKEGKLNRQQEYILADWLAKSEHTERGRLWEENEQIRQDRQQIQGMVWNDYPRPQMRREQWMSLNGTWELNHKTVLVPFPPQAGLSGYGKYIGQHLHYRKRFILPAEYQGKRILLHFGAVDQIANIYLNGQPMLQHIGGYLPFTVDVSKVARPGCENILEVKVTDTLSHRYPYGKQRKDRGGMWYTPVSGIWQSVWLEAVPEHYIKSVRVTADLRGVQIQLETEGEPASGKAGLQLSNGEIYEHELMNGSTTIDMHEIVLQNGESYQPVYWTPEHPYLYQMKLQFGEDEVSTYFGLRTVDLISIDGITRVCLNKEPIFLNGILDQGYFCDGIFLPAEATEYERDILRMKNLGFNLLRKHIKIEPELFYYYCDLHGMLVMQDMVNSGRYSFLNDTALPTIGVKKRIDTKTIGSTKRKEFFERHMEDTLEALYNHPCIIAYALFNEGWGQFDSDRLYEKAKAADPTRLYDSTSGWFHQNQSDFDSRHIYFMNQTLSPSPNFPLLVSECGGYTYVVEGHSYAKFDNYGYGKCENEEELAEKIRAMYDEMILPAVKDGLCGCIYTQLSDVEDETNGLYTYDRRINKTGGRFFCPVPSLKNE